MASPYANTYMPSYNNNTSEKIQNTRNYLQQLENMQAQENQRMMQYQQMQQPVQQQQYAQPMVQPQSNVDWITIRAYSEAKDIVLGNSNEKWFRVDDAPVIGMKFIENGFEKIEYYNLTAFDPFAQNQNVTEVSQLDLTGYVKEDTMNDLVIGLNNKIIALENEVKQLRSYKTAIPVVEKTTTTSRKGVSNDVSK